MQISIKDNIKEMTKLVSGYSDQIPFVTAKTMTDLAVKSQGNLKSHMKGQFKNPKKITLNSFRVVPATKRNLTSQVLLKDVYTGFRDHWLQVHIDGGARQQKKSEKLLGGYWVISKHQKAGRLTGARMSKILADVKAYSRGGINTYNKKTKVRYFVRHSRGRRIIFDRSGKNTVKPVLVEIKQPRYKIRIPFTSIVNKTVTRHYRTMFMLNFKQAIKTARLY